FLQVCFQGKPLHRNLVFSNPSLRAIKSSFGNLSCTFISTTAESIMTTLQNLRTLKALDSDNVCARSGANRDYSVSDIQDRISCNKTSQS
ncbi:MAG TPA: hypothetical protein IAA33_02600, partial [Candidatus Helicobacter avicola]|nr:hypothetical protein [Candidatus Helicobacter avicola]